MVSDGDESAQEMESWLKSQSNNDDEEDREAAQYFMEREINKMTNKTIDKRRVTLENTRNYIPLGSGRPKRNVIINQNDIFDIMIDLHECKTVDQFIQKM